jgi:hypothetical protein
MAITTLSPAIDINPASFPSSFRNRVINGEMAIDQQNGGASVSVTGAVVHSVDMITADSVGGPGVFSMQRLSATPPTGFVYYLRATTTTIDASLAAGDYYRWYYIFEGQYTRDLQYGFATAKTITLSFWARSSLTGTFSFGLLNGNGGNRTITGTYTINSANTWEYKTVTLPGNPAGVWVTDNTASIYLFMNLGSGTTYKLAPGAWAVAQAWSTTGDVSLIQTNGATLDITGLQFEIGTGATPFDYRPFPIEVQLCQRYYEKSYALDTAPGASVSGVQTAGSNTQGVTVVYSSYPFAVQKRVAPSMNTFTETGGSGNIVVTNSSAVDSTVASIMIRIITTSFNFAQNTAGTVSTLAKYHFTADARL